jgi:hypothetical protein
MDRDSVKNEIKEYSAQNVEMLCKLDNSSYDAWGSRFGLNRGQVHSYVTQKTIVPLDIARAVSKHYGILLDDFIGKKLTEEMVGTHIIEAEPDEETPDFSNGLSKKDAEELYSKFLKEKKKVEVLMDSMKRI